MTSPERKRCDRSRKLTQTERLEIGKRAIQTLRLRESPGAYGAPCAPLTRGDCVMIGKAVRGGWDVPEAKRREIVQQMLASLESDDDRLTLAVLRLVIVMEASNEIG